MRNRDAILEVLTRVLPPTGRVLEIASGSGEHAVYFARALPSLTFTPSDADPEALASIEAYRMAEALPNFDPPRRLDVSEDGWERAFDAGAPVAAILCINMIHIAPIEATYGLFRGAARLLAPGAPLFLYGPYRERDVPTAPSNEAFDRSLRERDPRFGLREREEVCVRGERHGFRLVERVAMPANNLSLVFVAAGA